MAKATKKKTSDNSKIKNAIEETKKDIQNEIIKESFTRTVSKKCFERYFTLNEENNTLTPKNNPPIELFDGFINYILTSPKLKEYREKELGIYTPTRKEYLALIYNKFLDLDFSEYMENIDSITTEISKLELITDCLLRFGCYESKILSNLFSEEEIIEKIKDFIFDDKETIKINNRNYNRNRKAESDFLAKIFLVCIREASFYKTLEAENPKHFYAKLQRFCLILEKEDELYKINEADIYLIYSLCSKVNLNNSGIKFFIELIRNKINYAKLDYTNKKIIIDWKNFKNYAEEQCKLDVEFS